MGCYVVPEEAQGVVSDWPVARGIHVFLFRSTLHLYALGGQEAHYVDRSE